MEGFWTGWGAPASVDWCEPNYVVTHYVAEFWNTMTSVPMFVLGMFGLYQCIRSDVVRERRFAWCFASLAMVGLGSVGFHGTLLRSMQALDELPMVYLGLVAAWIVRFRQRPRGDGMAAAALMLAYAVAFTIAYFWIADYFSLFIATYATVVAYLVIRSVQITWLAEAPDLMSKMLAFSAVGYLGTLTFCWIPEHVLLACDHPLQALPLHAFWHIGAGFGTYVWLLWCIVDRRQLEGVATRLMPWFKPFVSAEDEAVG